MLLQQHDKSPLPAPLLSPLGDDRLGTGSLRLKPTARNYSSPKGDKRGALS